MNPEAILVEFTSIVKPMVEAIEESPPVTQGHYDQYMALINDIATKLAAGRTDRLEPARKIAAVVLIRAGANRTGIIAALGVLS